MTSIENFIDCDNCIHSQTAVFSFLYNCICMLVDFVSIRLLHILHLYMQAYIYFYIFDVQQATFRELLTCCLTFHYIAIDVNLLGKYSNICRTPVRAQLQFQCSVDEQFKAGNDIFFLGYYLNQHQLKKNITMYVMQIKVHVCVPTTIKRKYSPVFCAGPLLV